MSLLGRVGKHFTSQFGGVRPHQFRQERDALSLGQFLAAPPTMGAIGAGIGGAMGAADGDAGEGAMTGGAIGAGLGAAGVAPLISKRLIIAVARAIKQHVPDAPDEEVLREAQRIASSQDAWAKLKKLGINDPRDLGE